MESKSLDTILIGLESTSVYDELESAETLAYIYLQKLTTFIMVKKKNPFPDPAAVVKSIQKAALLFTVYLIVFILCAFVGMHFLK